MPRIYVEFQRLKEIGERCSSVANKVDDVRLDFNNTVKKLDWDFKAQYDINKRATVISRQLEDYRKILTSYQKFINETLEQYSKLENYENVKPLKSLQLEDDSRLKKWAKDFFSLKSNANTFSEVGSVGDFFSWIRSVQDAVVGFNDGKIAKGSVATAESGFYLAKLTDSMWQHKEAFEKAAGTIGTKEAAADWAKDALGYQTHSGISSSFLENIQNPDSPFSPQNMLNKYKWNGGLDPSDAAVTAEQLTRAHKNFVFAVGEVAFSGIAHGLDNIDEMKKSNGEMSVARAGAETVIETAVDFGLNKVSYAVIGAGITSALVVAGAPVAAGFLVGAVVSGLAVTLLDTGVTALTGKPIAEWASDFIIENAKNKVKSIGDKVKSTAESFANWFGKLTQPNVAVE